MCNEQLGFTSSACHTGSRSNNSSGIDNWSCDWKTFLLSWGVGVGDLRLGPDRSAPESLRRPFRDALGPVAGEAAFTPRLPPGRQQVDIDSLVHAVTRQLDFKFSAVCILSAL
jgi:hypothetical protein